MAAANLDTPVQGLLVEHDETGPRVPAEVTDLDVVDPVSTLNPSAAPLVPYRRDECSLSRTHVSEYGDDRPLEQIP
jgi:hypothetical protein